ncbi:hypothetical protein [Colwellia sp. PAMC 20917]|uniref:hypothetical protein n=1 Tax=Colwellia sp. PAMC 20917 TaxID=1816218 RepID=UPI0012F87EFD|nr:hypothetical protein [Colwellia sp. PAMC 20917]
MEKVSVVCILLLVTSCAKTIQVPSNKLGDYPSIMEISSPDLKGYIAIPLVSNKVVDVSIYNNDTCSIGGNNYKGETLGEGTLTPSDYAQKVSIPSNTWLVIQSESEEFMAGQFSQCKTALRFYSEIGKNYIFRFKPGKSFGYLTCSGSLTEVIVKEGIKKEVEVSSVLHGTLNYKGFWEGNKLGENLCQGS